MVFSPSSQGQRAQSRRKQVRPRTALFVVLLVAVGFRCQQGEAATTADGVVLINEASAATGLPGCPTTGFPIVICHQGSYRLSGNLTVSNADVSVWRNLNERIGRAKL